MAPQVPPTVRDAVLGRDEPARRRGAEACSRPSRSSRRMSRCGCSTRSCRTRSCTSTHASRRACCRARAARCRSGTSSPASRSSSRSGRTGARSCTGASSRRCAIRPRARRRTRRSSPTTRRPPATRARCWHYATAAGTRAASQGAHREAAAQYARALRFAGSLRPAELGRPARTCSARALPHESYGRRGRRTGARARVLSRARRSPQRVAGAVLAVGDALVSRPASPSPSSASRDAVDVPSTASSRDASWRAPTSRSPSLARRPSRPRSSGRRRAQRLAERLGEDRYSAAGSRRDRHHALRRRWNAARAPRGSRRRSELAAAAGTRRAGRPELERPGLGREPPPRTMPTSIATSRPGSRTAASTISRSTRATCMPIAHEPRSIEPAGTRRADAAMVVVHDRGPSIIPLLSALVVAALARARQGVAGSSELLERAAELAEQQDRLFMIAPVAAAARAEVAWLEGRRDAIPGLTDAAARSGRSRGCAARGRCGSSGGDGASACAILQAPDGRPMPRRSRATGRRPRVCGPSSAAPTRRRSRSATPTTTTRCGAV